MTSTTTAARQAVGWRALVTLAAAGDLALLLAQGLPRRDLEALAVAAAMVAGAALLRLRGGLAGLVVLALSFANLVVWMLPAAASNAANGDRLANLALPGALAALSLAGLVACLAAIATRRAPAPGGGTVRWTGVGAVAAVAAVLAVATAVGPGPATAAGGGALTVDMANAAFEPTALTAPSGQVTIQVVNRDLFWHSLTIDQPAVNVDVPVGGARRLTFTLPPGTYQFYCRVPGHRQAGMVGTLTVG